MSTEQQRKLIIEYWFRTLITNNISTEDMFKIILDFGKVYEAFVICAGSPGTKIENDGQLMIKKDGGEMSTVFGTVTAIPGLATYHWKLKIIEYVDQDINLGIIEADECEGVTHMQGWWGDDIGCSYWSFDGFTFHGHNIEKYGDSYGKGDVIDVWLNMDKDQRELSFAKNDKKYGKAYQVCEDTKYKLAITVYGDGYKVELISFEIY